MSTAIRKAEKSWWEEALRLAKLRAPTAFCPNEIIQTPGDYVVVQPLMERLADIRQQEKLFSQTQHPIKKCKLQRVDDRPVQVVCTTFYGTYDDELQAKRALELLCEKPNAGGRLAQEEREVLDKLSVYGEKRIGELGALLDKEEKEKVLALKANPADGLILGEEQRELLDSLLSLTPQQIDQLPPTQRTQVRNILVMRGLNDLLPEKQKLIKAFK
jgi:hypothetical protein